MTDFWRAPVGAWRGEPAFILGGGPSLTPALAAACEGKGRVVAVNDAGLILAPRADVLFWADKRWLEWNGAELGLHTGEWKVTRKTPPLTHAEYGIKTLAHTPQIALSEDPGAVAGFCGGASALNLAWLLGADPIVLLGFDMRPGRWHDRHKSETFDPHYENHFLPLLRAMGEALHSKGATVINATPGSALDAFPIMALEETGLI